LITVGRVVENVHGKEVQEVYGSRSVVTNERTDTTCVDPVLMEVDDERTRLMEREEGSRYMKHTESLLVYTTTHPLHVGPETAV